MKLKTIYKYFKRLIFWPFYLIFSSLVLTERLLSEQVKYFKKGFNPK